MPEVESESVENGDANNGGGEVKPNKALEKLKKKKSVKARKSEVHKSDVSIEQPSQNTESPMRTRPISPETIPRSPLPETPKHANGAAKTGDAAEPDDDALREGMATALFDYDPQENDELAFSEGAVLEILVVQDDGWVTARDANGATGLVPGNYVKMLRVDSTKHEEDDTEVSGFKIF
jgi:hypothetical protein